MGVRLGIGEGLRVSSAVKRVDCIRWCRPWRSSWRIGNVAGEATVDISRLAWPIPVALLALVSRVMRTPPLAVVPEANRVGVVIIHEKWIRQGAVDLKSSRNRLLCCNTQWRIKRVEDCHGKLILIQWIRGSSILLVLCDMDFAPSRSRSIWFLAAYRLFSQRGCY